MLQVSVLQKGTKSLVKKNCDSLCSKLHEKEENLRKLNVKNFNKHVERKKKT